LTSEYKYVVDTQSKVVQAKREGRREGKEEGRLEGRQEGRLEGRQEGRLEGRQEGRLEGRQEGLSTVLELIKAGYSLEAIQERFRTDKNFSDERH
jgi:predicted transposase YdaD